MKARVQTTIGKTIFNFEVEERNTMETLHQASVLGNPPTYCGECKTSGAENFSLDSNKDKEGNIYVNVRCRKCGAKAKLGQYKSGGYFWHKFEVYKKDSDTDSSKFLDEGEG